MATAKIKETFRAAEPVSYKWYNDVAKRLNGAESLENFRNFPGFNASNTQALLHVQGVLQWVDVEEC